VVGVKEGVPEELAYNGREGSRSGLSGAKRDTIYETRAHVWIALESMLNHAELAN
jgi:hypothetical protein